MGIAASREFATEIVNCANKGVGLGRVLENPKWKLSYRRLPPELKNRIRKITSPPREDCLSKIQQLQKSDIGISKKLRPHFESWRHPKTFFDYNASVVAVEDAVSQVYVELRRIADRRVDDPIRARIYAVALYNLRLLVDRNESLQLRPEVREKIEQVIFDSPLVDESLEDISKWTRVFLKFGERMKMIAMRNGGLGALIVIPSSLLSVRQWAQRLNDIDFDHAVQHLQSIEVAEVAEKAEAHTVANHIHGLILQKFSEAVEDPGTGHDERMADEEVEKDTENVDEGSADNDEMFYEDDGLSANNQSSVCANVNTSDQAVYPHQEHSNQVEVGTGKQITTDNTYLPVRTFDKEATSSNSPLDFLSQVASLAYHQNRQPTEEFNLVPTPHNSQSLGASLPSDYMKPQQQHNSETELNQVPTNKVHDSSTLAAFPSAAPINLSGHYPRSSYMDPGVQVDPTENNLWNSSYMGPGETLVDPTEQNLWNSYNAPDGTLVDPTGHNLWSSYIATDETFFNPSMYIADPPC